MNFEDFQPKALAALQEAKGAVKALVLPTGSGKTRVALQYAVRQLGEKSVAYLVESNHLARQVAREASKVGVEAVFIPGKYANPDPEWPERRRQLLEDYEFGEHVGVFTYQGYFLGSGVPRAQLLVIDDAHALAADELSLATVVLKRDWDERGFDKVVAMIQGANPALAERIDALTLPVHRGGEAVLVPPLAAPVAEDVGSVIRQFTGTGRYEMRMLGDRLRSIPSFAKLPLVVTRDTVAWQPFLLPFRSFGESASSAQDEKEILLVTATAGPDGFLQGRLGLDQKPTVVTVADVPEMGSRLVLSYPEVYTGPNVNSAQSNTIRLFAERFGSVLVTSLSGHVISQLADHIGDKVKIVDYAALGADPLKEFESIGTPKVLLLVNRPSGVDIPSGLCQIGIHLDLPYSSSGHERVARDVAGAGTALEASLAIRLTQLLGRLNRSPTDRSVHILLTSEPPLARGSVFSRTLEPAILLDLFIGKKIRRSYSLPNDQQLVDAAENFLKGDARIRDEHVEFGSKMRSAWTAGDIGGFEPGQGDLVTANRNLAIGNWQQAFNEFHKLGVDAANASDGEAAAFYFFQGLCAMDGSGIPGKELLPPGGRVQLIDMGLGAGPSNPAILAALHQAKIPGKPVSSVREADLAELRRQALFGLDRLLAEDDEVPEDLTDAAGWTKFWTKCLLIKEHEHLTHSFALAVGVLGGGTPAKGAGDNDLLLRWGGSPIGVGLAVEVKGRLDAKGADESAVSSDNVQQTATNAKEVETKADVAVLFTSKSKLDKSCNQQAHDLGVRIITGNEAPQLAAILANQCVALARVKAKQSSLSTIPLTVADLHRSLAAAPGGRFNLAGLAPAAASD